MASNTPKKSPRTLPPPIVLIGLGLVLTLGGYQGLRWLSPKTLVNVTFPASTVATGARTSSGKAILTVNTQKKQAGASAFAQGDYLEAAIQFKASLAQQPNDPEARIYLQNAQALQGNPLKLAVSVPIGTDINLAKEVLRGVSQAQQEVNNLGGVNGRKILIVIANDDNDVAIAQKIAQDFVNQSDILGVVGHIASNVTLATTPTYDQGKLVMISPISSAVQLSNRSRYVFRTLPSDYVAARSLADYMLTTQKHQKAVVFFNSQSDYSRSLKGEFSTAIALGGGQIVAEFDLADSGFSASQSLEQALKLGAQTIMLASSTSALDRALQVVQVNRGRLALLGGDDVYGPKTLEVSQENGLDMVVAVPWHILGDPSSTFPARSRQLWGGDINWRTVTAFDATQALITALQSNPTRAGVQQALAQEDFSAIGASSPIRFLPSGDRNAAVQRVAIVKGTRSGYGFDFEPLR